MEHEQTITQDIPTAASLTKLLTQSLASDVLFISIFILLYLLPSFCFISFVYGKDKKMFERVLNMQKESKYEQDLINSTLDKIDSKTAIVCFAYLIYQ